MTTTTRVRIFNDVSRSRLSSVYQSFADIEACTPTVRVGDVFVTEHPSSTAPPTAANEGNDDDEDDVKFTLKELQMKIFDSVDYCRERTKEITVEPSITGACVASVTKELLNLPKLENGSACVRAIKVRDFEAVKFEHSRLEPAKSGGFKVVPPMFKITVPKCLPNTAQNINTGYVLEIPVAVEKRQLVENRMITDAKPSSQTPFIIIPQIMCKNDDVVPALQARDADDSGPFTVNIYNRNGDPCVLFVYLYAYQVSPSKFSVRYENADNADIRILKSKDGKANRHVYNLAVRSLFAGTECEIEQPRLRLKCFDGTKPGHGELLKKTVLFDNVCTFFCSRKREWFDPNLLTVSGLFRPNGKSVLPVVAEQSEFSTNTHCCVFLETRSVLFSIPGRLGPFHLGINGSLIDTVDYKELKRARKSLVRDVLTMRTGARMCNRLVNTAGRRYADRDVLMRLYDYGYQLSDDDKLEETYRNRDDEQWLFDNAKDTVKSAITARIYRNFIRLASRFFIDADTSEKRRHAIGDRDDEKHKRKTDDDADVESSKKIKPDDSQQQQQKQQQQQQ